MYTGFLKAKTYEINAAPRERCERLTSKAFIVVHPKPHQSRRQALWQTGSDTMVQLRPVSAPEEGLLCMSKSDVANGDDCRIQDLRLMQRRWLFLRDHLSGREPRLGSRRPRCRQVSPGSWHIPSASCRCGLIGKIALYPSKST
jgi:hypothetical protein